MKKNTKVTKDEIFNVRCTKKQKELLEKVAASEGVALSTWVLQAALVTAQTKQAPR